MKRRATDQPQQPLSKVPCVSETCSDEARDGPSTSRCRNDLFPHSERQASIPGNSHTTISSELTTHATRHSDTSSPSSSRITPSLTRNSSPLTTCIVSEGASGLSSSPGRYTSVRDRISLLTGLSRLRESRTRSISASDTNLQGQSMRSSRSEVSLGFRSAGIGASAFHRHPSCSSRGETDRITSTLNASRSLQLSEHQSHPSSSSPSRNDSHDDDDSHAVHPLLVGLRRSLVNPRLPRNASLISERGSSSTTGRSSPHVNPPVCVPRNFNPSMIHHSPPAGLGSSGIVASTSHGLLRRPDRAQLPPRRKSYSESTATR